MKPSIAIGEDAAGKLTVLAVSHDADVVKKAYQQALDGGAPGVVKVALFIRPAFERRGVIKCAAPKADAEPKKAKLGK